MGKIKWSNDVSFEEFISLLEMFYGTAQVAIKATKDEIISHAEDYLQRGNRLVTLAKQHFAKRLEELSVTSFEELLFSVDDSKDTLINSVGKKVIRPILRETPIKTLPNGIKALDESYGPYKELMEYLGGFNVAIEPIESCRYYHRFHRDVEAGDTMLLCHYEDETEDFYIYGTKCHTHSKGNFNILFKNGDNVCDIACFLAWLVVLSVFRKTLSDPESESFKAYADEYLKHYAGGAFRSIGEHLLPCSRSSLRKTLLKDLTDEDFSSFGFNILNHRKWLIPIEAEEDFKKLQPFMEKYPDIQPEYVGESYEDVYDIVEADIEEGFYKKLEEIPAVVSEDIIKLMFRFNPMLFMKTVPNLFRYGFCLSSSRKFDKSNKWAMPGNFNVYSELCAMAFSIAHKKVHETLVELKSLRQSQTDYASSFETKKNINKSTLKAMEESIFNEYFGYVEFDNEVDLEKVAVIADEFVAFKESYLPGIDSTKNAIRFRKLGNHKALGLYYPYAKCLCVDISSPSSLLHEYAHLIDYCYGGLSDKSEFYRVKYMYKELLSEAIRKDDNFRKKMKGKTKYNWDYFSNPTEIFARSFEIYVSEVLTVNNSLTPKTEGYEYPKSEKFITALKEYFDAILPALNNTEEEIVVAKTAATPL